MIHWRAIVACLCASVVAGTLIPIDLWDSVKQPLLVASSVLAAGVLVRLARGLPFTNSDQFEVEEIRALTKAVKQVMRALRMLIFMLFIAMISLAFVKPILDRIAPSTNIGMFSIWARVLASGLLGFLFSYGFMRITHVVHGDYDLVDLQSGFMVRAVERKAAKQFEDQHSTGVTDSTVRTPEGYGKIIQ
jgi:hypothetical protein